MSAFIVSKETMDRVVSAIDKHRGQDFGGIHLVDSASCDRLGRKLYAMNLDAVIQRYPGDTKDTAPGPIDIADIHGAYKWKMSLPAHHAAVGYKAISSLLYQCSEGNVPERPLYKALDALYDSLAHRIASDSKTVQRAIWD